jgi:hypothetical protein
VETTTPLLAPDVPVKHIYKALVAVMAELARVGIAKDRKNEQQHFRFRGIDDVMNVVTAILAKNDVCFLPWYDPFPDIERITESKKTLIHAKVQGTYRLVSAQDGSEVMVSVPGTAMDLGDKACNKAMSAALKYAFLHTFLIPTESNEDADATTPEPSVPKPPAAFDEWFEELTKVAPERGYGAFLKVWKKTTEDCRQYATTYLKPESAKAKARAQEVTAKAKAAAQPETAETTEATPTAQ